MSGTDQAQRTSSDPDDDKEVTQVEDAVENAFDATVEAGAERLHRSWRALITTGLFGGMEVGLGVLAFLAVLDQTGSHLLAGFAFSIGLVALFLAHSDLFTEGFLLPVMAVFAGRGSVTKLFRLWGVAMVTNLIGGWVFMLLVTRAFPEFDEVLMETARHFLDAPLDLRSVCLALLAGIVITVLTRMQHGTESDGVKVFAAVVAGFLLAGLSLFHSILDSIIIFGAILGPGTASYSQWIAWFWYVALLNAVGGLVFVTALRLVRASELPQAPGPDALEAAGRSASSD